MYGNKEGSINACWFQTVVICESGRPKECTERSGTVVLVISLGLASKGDYVFMVVIHIRENSWPSVRPVVLLTREDAWGAGVKPECNSQDQI